MNSLITFLLILALNFTVLLIALPGRPASDATQQRIVAIQSSLRMRVAEDSLLFAALAPKQCATRVGSFFRRFRAARRLELLLAHAGSGMSIGGFILTSFGCTVLLGIVMWLLAGLLPAAIVGAAGVVGPLTWLRIKRSRRMRAFDAALPDAIDLLARALRAGHSVGSAVEMVGEQSPEPLAFEFVQVFQQQRLGLPFRDALMQMCERVPSRDLHFLVTAILIQKETGGDLTEILDRTAHVIRERIRIEGEVRTRTAQGRLTGWILALLPVVMLALLNLVNPGYSDLLFHDPQGRQLLYIGAGLIFTGTLIIRKIVDVRV